MFFLFTTKNLNWENWSKTLIPFKNKMWLRMKNLNFMGVQWKIQFLGVVGYEKPIYRRELPKKGRLGQFEDLRGRLKKNRRFFWEWEGGGG